MGAEARTLPRVHVVYQCDSRRRVRLLSSTGIGSDLALHAQVPFSLLATAYRRKRILEGLVEGDKMMTAQVKSSCSQHV